MLHDDIAKRLRAAALLLVVRKRTLSGSAATNLSFIIRYSHKIALMLDIIIQYRGNAGRMVDVKKEDALKFNRSLTGLQIVREPCPSVAKRAFVRVMIHGSWGSEKTCVGYNLEFFPASH
ncbi:MAG: hypothetical protein HNEKOMLI_00789 [Sodalis sp. Psp]|nr:hypothetical protein [Sodalis sp. Psp]MCR3757234.1 hypothetical protein [Sodalis sp. Ppy]